MGQEDGLVFDGSKHDTLAIYILAFLPVWDVETSKKGGSVQVS